MRYTGRLAGTALAGAALLLSVPGGAAGAATLPTLQITGLTQIIADSVHNHLFLANTDGVVVTNLTGTKLTTWGAGTGTGSIATDGTSVYVVESVPGAIAAFSAATPNATPVVYQLPQTPVVDTPSSVAFQAGKIWVSYSNAAETGAIGYFNVGVPGTNGSGFHADALTTGTDVWPTPPKLAADPNPATEGTLVAVDNESAPTMIASFNVSGNAAFPRAGVDNAAFTGCTGLSDVAVAAGGGHFLLACNGNNTDLGFTSATLAPYAAANYPSGAGADAVSIAPDNTGFATGNSGAAPALKVFKAAGTVMTNLPLTGQTVAPDGLAWANDAVHLYAVLQGGGNYYLDALVYPQYRVSNLDLENTNAGTWVAGTKLTLKGKLTYENATGTGVTIPPLGTTVRILRRLTNKNVNTTLYVKTGTGGAFTVTDTPNPGSYFYTAYYPGTSTNSPAWHTVADRVVIAHTTLKVTTSSTLVKKGTIITVTAHLGKWHTNKTVTIYARVINGRWVAVKRALVSPRGILTVSVKISRKMQFTAYYSGDAWYAHVHGNIVTVSVR